ncbi:hypothetical protein [Fibrella forsythiae]|uniref:Monoheme cytochrome C n=1 Tax=Fibrella forsythiae TaxID=2817061 RepID=A0ABS3JS65_9BACT|nr:hypothetical protein [Fibrella forsythiae]MBO0952840.1 hypothetical protein [Fibrella forsythiae]
MEKETGNFRRMAKYRWLIASVCVWLLCAWVARQPVTQQPVPAKKIPAKAHTAAPVRRTTTAKKPAKAKLAAAVAAAETAPTDATALNGQGVMVDEATGLALGENMVLVKGQCTVCHSSKLILQSHFDRGKWVERIRWMQRTQELWDLGDTEKPILDYLVKNYGPLPVNFDGRRLPLSPPNWHTR